jgi:hypothetical protein
MTMMTDEDHDEKMLSGSDGGFLMMPMRCWKGMCVGLRKESHCEPEGGMGDVRYVLPGAQKRC